MLARIFLLRVSLKPVRKKKELAIQLKMYFFNWIVALESNRDVEVGTEMTK